ncbi:nucleoside-diphosphate kinase [Candidatus Pacearchaeota archaeon]|nr:nucleoside-diphosphate kinase [Candidatus Pacearchaeota archaeon]
MSEEKNKVKNEERSLILIKPDGLIKSLTGNIISKLSETELKIVGAKIVNVSRELAESHYEEHKEKPFFEELIKYIMGEYHTDRVFAMVYKGVDAITKVRELAGKTNPEEANPITIRGKYGRINTKTGVFENVIHASDCKENAEREIRLWFEEHEIVS